ncbi:ATP F0F1 synthase subunit I [Veronia nyctiphanis]|uniref:ATP F0F1 synthase subunit I n=1 Tax=Veronia nyctiphanis TaxID=1278244 RepID=A0A4Q0YMR4_9GAMM|nr:F0F1 ATP synthase subunit I [Veronia nyctiphanis]RXJ72182.1 ATP F0F1 synthase subunit I [Veronia nyctiphanis]
MVSTLARSGRRLAKRLLLLQACVVLATAITMAMVINVDWGISALIGGGIFVVANTAFAVCAFLFSGARAAKSVVTSFYGGEVLKILLTVSLFSVVYLYAEVELVPLKLTYLLVLGVNILAPVLFINNNK